MAIINYKRKLASQRPPVLLEYRIYYVACGRLIAQLESDEGNHDEVDGIHTNRITRNTPTMTNATAIRTAMPMAMPSQVPMPAVLAARRSLLA